MEHSARIFPTFDACSHLCHSCSGIRHAGAGPTSLYVEASNPEHQKVFSGKSQCFLSQRETSRQFAMLGQNIAMDIADESSNQRIRAFARQSECPLSVFKPFIEPTLDAQSPTCIDQRYDRRSFSVDLHGIVVTEAPASLDGFAEGFQRFAKLATIESGGSNRSISKPQLFQVATFLRAAKQDVGNFQALLEIGAIEDAIPQSPEDEEQMFLVGKPLAQCSCSGIGSFDGGGCVALGGDLRYAERNKHIEFFPVTHLIFGVLTTPV